MRECLYYWLVEPVRRVFRDEPSTTPALTVPIDTNTGQVDFALFVDEYQLPAYARLRFPCEEDRIPEDRLPLIQAVREHLLSVLRVTFHSDVDLFPAAIWTFIEKGAAYSVGLQISVPESPPSFQPEECRRLFTASFAQREEVRLFLDGGDKRIPLQYRYLSLYKLLELLLRPDSQWQAPELEAAFTPHAERVREAGFNRKPLKVLHELRDGCAHIRQGRVFGVTHLNHAQAARVEHFLPILIDVCVQLLKERYSTYFTVGRGEKPVT